MTTRVLHNMSCPPRTKVVLQGRPIAPRIVVFCLVQALCQAGLLEWPGVDAGCDPLRALGHYQEACRSVRRRWGTPRKLFAAIGEPKFLETEADFLIGWRPLPEHGGARLQFCRDPRLCAGVQAHCVGTLHLSRRQPELTWDRLLDAPVAFDDPLVPLA